MCSFQESGLKIFPQATASLAEGACQGGFDKKSKVHFHSWFLSRDASRVPLRKEWKPFHSIRSAIRVHVQQSNKLPDNSSTPAVTAVAAIHKDQDTKKPEDEKISFSGGDAVPTIFCGSVCTPSSPARKNEADTRLVLRMAMTGESLADLSQNLKKTYGPSMDLNILMKLMTAEQIDGKTLFYVNEDTLISSRAVRPSNYGQSTGQQGSDRNSENSGPEKPKQQGFSWPQVWKQVVHQCHDCHRLARFHSRVRAGIKLGGIHQSQSWSMGKEPRDLHPSPSRKPRRKNSAVASMSTQQNQTLSRSFTKAMPFFGYLDVARRFLWHPYQPSPSQKSKEKSQPVNNWDLNNSSIGSKPGRKPRDAWNMERIPLEAAFQLLMRSADKYRLVIDDDDVQAVQATSSSPETSLPEDVHTHEGTPMFAIRGLEVSLGTSKGPVNFVPLFFSRTELQKFYKTCRKIFKVLWLVRRSESREERRVMIEKKAAALGGVSQSIDPGFPASTTIEDADEEDGFGDGDPSEVKEFMEELGASGESGTSGTAAVGALPSIPTMIALGVVSFSAGVWKLFGDVSDILLMSSPLEPYLLGLPLDVPHKPLFLESCLQQFSALNKETSLKHDSSSRKHAADDSEKKDNVDILDVLTKPQATPPSTQDGLKLESLAGLQVMMRGAWHLVQVLQHAPTSLMYVGGRIATQDGSLLPDIRSLRQSNANVSVSTIIHIDEDAILPTEENSLPPKKDGQQKQMLTTCNMGLVLNLAQVFGSPDSGDLAPLTNDPVAMGIWMVGNLGMSQGMPNEGPPTLGFGNTTCLKNGIPSWRAKDISKGNH